MPVCPQCDNRPFSNREALLQHMKSSSAWHPFCANCDRRFSSQMAYDAHMADKHPPTFDCLVCSRSYHALFALEDHYRGSVAHPNCVRCGRGFKDAASCEDHQNTEHAEPFASHSTDSTISSVSCNVTAANQASESNPAEPDPESKDVSASSNPNANIVLVDKGGLSPSSALDRVQELITQGEQGAASPIDLEVDFRVSSPLTQVTPPFSPTSPSLLPRPGTDIEQYWTSRQNISASRRVPLHATTRIENAVSTSAWFGNRLRDPRSTLSPPMVLHPQINPPTILPSPPNTAQRPDFTSRLYPGSVRQQMRQNEALGRQRILGSDTRQWELTSNQSLLRYRGPGGVDEPRWTQSVRGTDTPQIVTKGNRPSIFYETLTPRGGANASEGSPQSSYDNLRHSPGSNNNEPDTRPTTASSTPCIVPVTYTITPSSECPSPQSPDVVSPVGLGVLPTISPLPSTPIDLIDFDIPEARKPLPESPVGSRTSSPADNTNSAGHILSPSLPVLLTEHLVSTSPLSTSSTRSYTTSPQEPLSVNHHSPTAQTSPITPVGLAATRSTSNPNPLHCRVCLADTCDDITASMCGHIFCNRCITNAVIKTNRCPVCMTPTLLYCLFRLDLAA